MGCCQVSGRWAVGRSVAARSGRWAVARSVLTCGGRWAAVAMSVADSLLPGRSAVAKSVADGLLPGRWLHAVGDGCRFAPHCTTWTRGVPSTWRLKEAGDGGAASEGVRCSFMDCSSINYHVL